MPAMLALLLVACSGVPERPGPPVLWISMDTVRADRLGVYGGPAATPTLDALARGSVVYEQAFSSFPETALSHWSMLTGVLPEVHGNVPAAGASAYTGPTAAELAKARGYATAAFIGGVTLQAETSGLDRGFDTYDDAFVVDPRDMKRDGADVVAAARSWIAGHEAGGDAPWFAFVHLFDAHFPYTPADPRRYDPDYTGTLDGSDAALRPWRDRTDGQALPARDVEHVRALYDAELTELDATLAPLLATAPADAIIVVTADHGESFEHGYLFNHRGALSDGTLHVPWILRVPGLAPTRVSAMVGLLDMLPTVAAAAGWTVDAPFQGTPMLPPTTGRAELWARTDPWMPGTVAGTAPGPLLALRTPRAKVIWAGDDTAAAWDLAADPGEDHPLAVPAEFMRARDRYAALLAAMTGFQKPVASRRTPAPGEHAMLQALGYETPEGVPGDGGAGGPGAPGAGGSGGGGAAVGVPPGPPNGGGNPPAGPVGPQGPPPSVLGGSVPPPPPR
jgi:arylsulfatase A-like enzyme